MRIVGLKPDDGTVLGGALSSNGAEVVVLRRRVFLGVPARDRRRWPHRTHVSGRALELPPVVKSARVLCVGLNYPDHVKEGTYRDTQLPEIPPCLRGGRRR